MSLFNVLLTEITICYFNKTCARNEPVAKLLTSWLVPSFSQHDLCLVVLGRCLLILVMKFQDKFASLRQLNKPNSRDKYQICCFDMYLIRFLANFAVFCMFLWIHRLTWISRLHDCAEYKKPWYYELHHLHWQLYFYSWSPRGNLRIFLISSPDITVNFRGIYSL